MKAMPVEKHVEVLTYPILLQPGDRVRLWQHDRPIVVEETSLLVWVDQAPGDRFAHPSYAVLIGAKKVLVQPGTWWLEVNGRRFPSADGQIPGLVSPVEYAKIAVHVVPEVVVPSDALMDGPTGSGTKLPIERESVVLWVDLHPELRFVHDTRYVILDAKGAHVVEGQWWPTFDGQSKALGPPLANLSRWTLGTKELPSSETPQEPVSTVGHLDIAPLRFDGARATLTAVGTVPSAGWSRAELLPWEYLVAPADGIWDYDFAARPPTRLSASVVSRITARTGIASLRGIAGVRVHARDNTMTLRIPELHDGKPEPRAAFEVVDARFESDQLVIDVTYSGGCNRHAFHLLLPRESDPGAPRMELFLVHEDGGDPCEGIVSESLRFDMLGFGPKVVHVSNGLGWEVELTYGAGDEGE